MFRVCRATYSIYKSNHGINLGTVRFPTLGYLAKGNAYYELDGKAYELSSGSLIWLPLFTSRGMKAQSREVHIHSIRIHMRSCSVIDCDPLIGKLPAKAEVVTVSNPAHVESLFKLMVRLWVQRSAHAELEMQGVGLQIVAQFLNARGEPNVQPHVRQRIDTVLDHIANHFTNPDLSLDELARLSGWSKQYFIAVFQKMTGQTPMAYVRRLQINLSMDLLGQGDGTVAEIAERVGFRDPAYFSRVFARLIGKPPSVYFGVDNFRYVRTRTS